MANINKLIENADNAYYATEYDKAIKLYKQVLDIDVDNKHARQQLRKSEINRSSKDANPSDLPVEALQYYKRSRSLIMAGDLTEAKRLLKRAIQSAENAGVDFVDAERLMENLLDALKAAEFRKKALDELDTQHWAKAEVNLTAAHDLDPTDGVTKILMEHLKSLLRAQQLINNLNDDNISPAGRSVKLGEVRRIIDQSGQTTALSKLWQEVATLLRENTNRNFDTRIAMMTALITSLILIFALWLIYLVPRKHVVVDCTAVSPGLIATIDYPAYIAKGDKDTINVSFTNASSSIVNNSTVFIFDGSVDVRLVPPTQTNRIEFKALNPKEKKFTIIHFSVDEEFQLISNSGDYVEFGLCVGTGDSNKFHIVLSPIYALRSSILILWGSVGLWLFKLFGDNIKSKVVDILNKKNNFT